MSRYNSTALDLLRKGKDDNEIFSALMPPKGDASVNQASAALAFAKDALAKEQPPAPPALPAGVPVNLDQDAPTVQQPAQPQAAAIATKFVNAGGHVIFFPRGTKRCAVPSWEQKATNNLEAALSWAGQDPSANVGIVGKQDGLWGLDDDGGLLAEYEAQHGPIKTYTTRTVSGGRHFIFRQNAESWAMGNVTVQDEKKRELLSARVNNRYVVAAGSWAHPHNDTTQPLTQYLAVDPKAPFTEAPESLLQFIKDKESEWKAKVNGNKPASQPQQTEVGVGGRNNYLAQRAGALRGIGASYETILLDLNERNERDCKPPLPEGEVEKIAKSYSKYEEGKPTNLVFTQQPDPEEQARAVAEQAAREEERADEELKKWLEFTDLQNSELFVQNNKDSVRANHGGSKGRTTWYVWDGSRWKKDVEGRVVRLAKEIAVTQMESAIAALSEAIKEGMRTGVQDEAVMKGLKQRCKAARECCSDYRIHSMLNLAASGTEISVVMTQLDAQANLINFRNGTLDTDKMQLRPHRKEDLLTQLINIDYDPNAKCPKWEATVNRLFSDKPYMPAYFQRVVGYFLAAGNPEQVFFIFYGPPGGGKTTVRNVIKALLGEYGRAVPQGMFLTGYRRQSPDAPSPSHAALYGSHLAVSEELDEDVQLDCGLVKMISGGGQVSARPLYEPPFEYTPDYKLLFLTNYTPKITDFSGGIDDRLRVVKMEQRIRNTPDDVKDFFKILIREELPGILAWAIRGLKDVRASGLQDPEEVRLMTKDFMESENIVHEWLEERTEPGTFVSAAEAHRDFIWWAKGRGEDTKPWSQRWFSLRMSHLGWTSKVNASSVRGYRGLKLKPQPGALAMSSKLTSEPISLDPPERVN